MCLGERGQDELHNRKPHLDLATTRYPRVLDEFENVFRKERNETFETYQLLSRKQRDGETLEEFQSVLSGLAARCSLGALERRVLRDVFIVNMSNKEAQMELCRSTKHTLTLANGSVLRKSGVAEKVIKTNAPNTASKLTLPPPAMSALKRRAELKRALSEQAAGTSRQSKADNRTRESSPAEEADSDSEYEPITISKYSGNPTTAPGRNVEENAPKEPKDVENVAGRPNLSEGSGVPTSKGVDTEVQTMSTEQGGSAPNLSNEGQGEKQPKKKGERGRRLRLVSYSSQESEDQDGTGSRKSTRKRTAVSKFGGVMIDSILKARTT